MITGFFLQIFFAFLNFLVGLLPAVSFPAAITAAIQTVWYYINGLSFLFPVSTLLTVLGFAMLFHVSILLWRLMHLIGGYIRGR